VCPRCRRAKGVDLSTRTTSCPCGFEIRVVPSHVHARTERLRDLAGLVGRVNAEISGDVRAIEEAKIRRTSPRSPDVHARVVAASAHAGDRIHRIRAAAVELTKELEVFSLDDWKKVASQVGIRDPERALAQLARERIVYEPRPGFFRAVELSL
jgi:hypothetical protein